MDTFTKVGMDSVAYSANSGSMDREKHYMVGVPGEGGVAIPNRGDYQALDALGKGYNDLERRGNIWGLTSDVRQKFVESAADEYAFLMHQLGITPRFDATPSR